MRLLALIKNNPGFFLVGFSAGSNLNVFLLQLRSSCYLKNISFVSITSACNAVMDFYVFSVSALS